LKNKYFILALLFVLLYGLFFWFVAPPRSIWRILAIGIGFIVFGTIALIKKKKDGKDDKFD
jgi:hypothetical protein